MSVFTTGDVCLFELNLVTSNNNSNNLDQWFSQGGGGSQTANGG